MTGSTDELFRTDAYLASCTATVTAAAPTGIRLDRTVFYPDGGGQPGDSGMLRWPGGVTAIADTRKDPAVGGILHIPAEGAALPPVGAPVEVAIDWERRYRHMRMHTALHLVCSLIPAPITGARLSTDKGYVDFDLPESPDRATLSSALGDLVRADRPITASWISAKELEASTGLVRTLTVAPPLSSAGVRIVTIAGIDSQACGGTHVRATGEIGPLQVAKIENKGRRNRRVGIAFGA